jgi:hypothetical protein
MLKSPPIANLQNLSANHFQDNETKDYKDIFNLTHFKFCMGTDYNSWDNKD